MDVRLAPSFRPDPEARRAAELIRQCVHCGFCNATCPTYEILGDESDGPRGRIYLVRELLEGSAPSERMRLHLDRCLTCLACETTCPSGVRYGAVADFGRAWLERTTRRPMGEQLLRGFAARLLPERRLLSPLTGLARRMRGLLPAGLRRTLMPVELPAAPVQASGRPTVLLHRGCVQPALRPSIDRAAAVLLTGSGHRVGTADGCCGALEFHLGKVEPALRRMRANLERWAPMLEETEAFVATASGCAAFLHRYPEYLGDDSRHAARARLLAQRLRDLAELVEPAPIRYSEPVAFHAPCTLQHHLHRAEQVARLLERAGARLVPVANAHLCCGSAGTYSLFQPRIARRLRDRKLEDLTVRGPRAILTANIGCLAHLQAGTELPLWHWAEWLVIHATARDA